jgi:hypothetical protein
LHHSATHRSHHSHTTYRLRTSLRGLSHLPYIYPPPSVQSIGRLYSSFSLVVVLVTSCFARESECLAETPRLCWRSSTYVLFSTHHLHVPGTRGGEGAWRTKLPVSHEIAPKARIVTKPRCRYLVMKPRYAPELLSTTKAANTVRLRRGLENTYTLYGRNNRPASLE